MTDVLVGQRAGILSNRKKEPIPPLQGRADQMQSPWVQRALKSPVLYRPQEKGTLRVGGGAPQDTGPSFPSGLWAEGRRPHFVKLILELLGKRGPRSCYNFQIYFLREVNKRMLRKGTL